MAIVTTLGQITYSRYLLIPYPDSKEALMKAHGVKSVAPLDCYLGLSGLPFKITPPAMLKIAYWAQNQLSHQRAEEAIGEVLRFRVNDDTVRLVSNYVGASFSETTEKKWRKRLPPSTAASWLSRTTGTAFCIYRPTAPP